MSRPIIAVGFDGENMSLKAWATKHGLPYSSVYHRWQAGIRDPEILKKGLIGQKQKPISQKDIDYLRETRYMRRGMAYEWKMACDLIGVPRCRAEDVRKAVEGESEKNSENAGRR